ncbi:MAG: glutamine-hydrolyzing carbamoyl-phosphate synthase small subunit [Candidatus Peribacteraceae bacterium]|nr:glutamine-hydrolyzing carbamoyl-phosphate synthase small subunit [Candidatus Peribacteraceae bacterium]MDD5742104.1 glutamine-hydrolyzing carbamoyl-phosphate synthase small subunit [Candidatus Peribacteraceae bacterium]
MASLILADGTVFTGESFGAPIDADGEVVFNTGMAGYPESLTDPSYEGQILVFTYPLIGNYGVPTEEKNAYGFADHLESERIHVCGVIMEQGSEHFSHQAAASSLRRWLEHHKIPAISGVDTRALTKKLREHGVMLGRITQKAVSGTQKAEIEDPNLKNLVAEVSCKELVTYEPQPSPSDAGLRPAGKENSIGKSVVVFDCGIKNNILRSFLKRGVTVHRVPWNYDLASSPLHYDGVFISNGPGDPKKCDATIRQIRWSLEKKLPTFGICLGNQLLALAIGGDTFKLKYGHRGVNQPCVEWELGKSGTWEIGKRCIITSQNHGFAVKPDQLPAGWKIWFTNANDGTVEGIRHESGQFFSVQFHPEATPGPEDANYLFDEFVKVLG